MVSVPESSPKATETGTAVAVAAGLALPSWVISILFHTGVLGAFAAFTWTVTRQAPDREFNVGIMVKKQTAEGPTFESRDATYTPEPTTAVAQQSFLPDSEPSAVRDALPQVPEVDLSQIGIGGSMLSGASEMLALPEGPSGSGVMVNTQFFGAQLWGSKFVYVIDRSGSMLQRDRLGAAKNEVLASLSKLPPETQFQIFFYNLQTEAVVQPKVVKLHFATEQNKVLAGREIGRIIAAGGTEHLPALRTALSLKPDVIIFLTDADDLRAQDVKIVTEMNRDLQARIHAIEFGIGSEVDSENQLRELARMNGGTYRYVDAGRWDPLRGGAP